MLYKPKFMSPDLNMDIKWAYYDEIGEEGNIKPIIFSCVCDGNSKIMQLKLELTWSNELTETENSKEIVNTYYFKKTFTQDFKDGIYPVNHDNGYNEIVKEINPNEIKYSADDNSSTFKKNDYEWKAEEDPKKKQNALPSFSGITDEDGTVIITAEQQLQELSSPEDKKIIAKYTLVSETGQKVYNHSTFYLKSKPTLQIKTSSEADDTNSVTEEDILKSSNQKFIGAYSDKTSITPPFFIQYYYWEVYDSSNNLITQSKKVYSQDIQFEYSNFLNNNTYAIKCYILNSIGELIIAKRVASVSYSSNPVNLDYTYQILPKETGIYFNWDKLNILSGRLYNSKNEEIFITENNSDNYIIEENIHLENSTPTGKLLSLKNDDYLTLNNLSFSDDTYFYWAGYIHPAFDTFSGWKSIFSIDWIDKNGFSRKTVLQKNNNQQLQILDNNMNVTNKFSWSGNSIRTYSKGTTTWYIIKITIDDEKPSIDIQKYYLNGLVYPGESWSGDTEENYYIELTDGVWSDLEEEVV